MKISNKVLMRSLPMVAAVLGKQYGVKIEVGGSSAYTDGNTIHLPGIDLEKSPEMVNLVRSYLDHESAHIRHTNFYYVKNQKLPKLTFDIFNIIEDWRVENELVKQFPGCRHNFDWLIKHHFVKDIQVTDKPEEIINYILYTVRNWDVPKLESNRQKLAHEIESLIPGLIPDVNMVLNSCKQKCQSTVDAVYFAKELEHLIRNHAKSKPNAKSTTQSENASEIDPQKDSTCSSKIEQETAAKSDQFKSNMAKMLSNPENGVIKDLAGMTKEQLESVAHNGSSLEQVAVEGFSYSESLSKSDIAKIKRSSVALHTRLQALLQSTVMKRRRPARYGKLNAARLHKINIDSKLFLRNEERQGLNCSVHILFDVSGSMRSRIKLATEACYAVTDSLSRINGVNVAVTAFPARDVQNAAQAGMHASVFPLLKHDEPVHKNFCLKATGTTPMGEAIWWVLQREVLREENRKIILIITDGQPDTVENTVKAIDQGKKMGVEFYGVGIVDQSVRKLMGKQSEVINKIDDLPGTLFKLLQNALLEERK